VPPTRVDLMGPRAYLVVGDDDDTSLPFSAPIGMDGRLPEILQVWAMLISSWKLGKRPAIVDGGGWVKCWKGPRFGSRRFLPPKRDELEGSMRNGCMIRSRDGHTGGLPDGHQPTYCTRYCGRGALSPSAPYLPLLRVGW